LGLSQGGRGAKPTYVRYHSEKKGKGEKHEKANEARREVRGSDLLKKVSRFTDALTTKGEKPVCDDACNAREPF